jgi:YD repeat-containing protein
LANNKLSSADRTTRTNDNINTTVYDPVGRILAQVDPLGNRTSFVYDVANDRVSTQNPLGAISTQVYNGLQQMVASVDPLGNRTSFGYDVVGCPVSTTNPLNFTNTRIYDVDSRVVATVDPRGNRTGFGFDGAREGFCHEFQAQVAGQGKSSVQ